MFSICSSPEGTNSVWTALDSKIKDQIHFSGLFFALIHFIAFGVAMLVFHVAKQDNGDERFPPSTRDTYSIGSYDMGHLVNCSSQLFSSSVAGRTVISTSGYYYKVLLYHLL
jgi:hypothetical protein